MVYKKYIIILQGIFFSFPLIAFAQDFDYVEELIDGFGNVIGLLIPVVIGLAVLLFLWGLATYILNQDQVEARVAARQRMVWGVIILFVIVSIWGLVALLGQITGVEPEAYDTVDLIPDI